MTDFLNDGYGRRCLNEYRSYITFFENNGHTLNTPVNRTPQYIKLHLCLMQPFIELAPTWVPLREKLHKCFEKNSSQIAQGNYEPCREEIELVDARGRREVYAMTTVDAARNEAVPQLLQSYRAEIAAFKHKKHMNCVAFPEQIRCSTLKANMFNAISENSCHELFKASNKCFEQQSNIDQTPLWKTLLWTDDRQSNILFRAHCDNLQRELIRCADKYFRLTVLAYEQEQTMEKMDPNFRRNIIHSTVGPVTLQQRKEEEDKQRKEKEEMQSLYVKARRQQEDQK